MPVDLNAVGKKLDSVTHTHTERDVLLYALGVGAGVDDLPFTYEGDLKVLPTFAVIPSFPAMLNLGGAMRLGRGETAAGGVSRQDAVPRAAQYAHLLAGGG